MGIILTLLVGAVAGWLGSVIYRGHGLGLLGNIVLGILGSFVGYWLLGKLNVYLGGGWLGIILTSAIGAIVILILINIIFGRRS